MGNVSLDKVKEERRNNFVDNPNLYKEDDGYLHKTKLLRQSRPKPNRNVCYVHTKTTANFLERLTKNFRRIKLEEKEQAILSLLVTTTRRMSLAHIKKKLGLTAEDIRIAAAKLVKRCFIIRHETGSYQYIGGVELREMLWNEKKRSKA